VIETFACRCLPGRRCVPAPNRCRKPLKVYEGDRIPTPDEWALAVKAAEDAIGEPGFEVLWCQSMELTLMRLPDGLGVVP